MSICCMLESTMVGNLERALALERARHTRVSAQLAGQRLVSQEIAGFLTGMGGATVAAVEASLAAALAAAQALVGPLQRALATAEARYGDLQAEIGRWAPNTPQYQTLAFQMQQAFSAMVTAAAALAEAKAVVAAKAAALAAIKVIAAAVVTLVAAYWVSKGLEEIYETMLEAVDAELAEIEGFLKIARKAFQDCIQAKAGCMKCGKCVGIDALVTCEGCSGLYCQSCFSLYIQGLELRPG